MAVALVAFSMIAPWLFSQPVDAAQFANRQITLGSSAPEENYTIGSTGPAGGLIFHIDGNTYYEAAPEGWNGGSDPSPQWGCYSQGVPGAGGTSIGTGEQNTADILAFHDDSSNFGGNDYYTYGGDYGTIGCHSNNDGTVAAKIASDYTGGGESGWFLPSLDELNAMYINLHQQGLGGFSDDFYWSASEYSTLYAQYQLFSDGDQNRSHKYTHLRMRPVRTFTHLPDTTNHTFTFDIATTGDIGAFRFEYCSNDPLPGEACTAPAGMDASDFTIDSQSGAAGFSKDATNTTTNEIVVSNGGLQSFTQGDEVTFDFSNIVNPSDTGTFYVRLYSYDGADVTTANIVDDGGVAVSTANQITVAAQVQEQLTFCVGSETVSSTGTCTDISGTAITLGVLDPTTVNYASDTQLETEDNSAYAHVSTNASHGAVVQYQGADLSDGANTINPIGSTASAISAGTEGWGLTAAGLTQDGGTTSLTRTTDYDNANEFAFTPDTLTTIASSTDGATAADRVIDNERLILDFAAAVDNTTPTGLYTTSLSFIATGSY